MHQFGYLVGSADLFYRLEVFVAAFAECLSEDRDPVRDGSLEKLHKQDRYDER